MSYIVKGQVWYAMAPNITPNDEKGYRYRYILSRVYICKTKVFRLDVNRTVSAVFCI